MQTTMSKKKSESTETTQPEFVGELLENGTVTLTAKSREKINDMLAEIPADCSYGAGAIGKNPETGDYSLRLDIINI